MTRKGRPHSKAEKAITPAQRTFCDHLNGSNAHPALRTVTNPLQTQDGHHVLDRSIKLEELSPISSQANSRGRLPRRDSYQPHTSRPRGGDYWPPLSNPRIRSDFYRPSRRRSRSPARYDGVIPEGSRLHSEDYRGRASVHDRYQRRAASRERDMMRSNRYNNESSRRSCRHNSPSPLRGLDTHHREPNRPEDLRVTMIVHIPERTGFVNSSGSQPAVSNFGAGHNVGSGTEHYVPDPGSRCVMQ